MQGCQWWTFLYIILPSFGFESHNTNPFRQIIRPMSGLVTSHTLVVDPFCMRQFQEGSIKIPVEDFEVEVNRLFDSGSHPLVDGYAPFCKHIFIPNFAGVLRTTIPITEENHSLLRSAYEARTEKELPVLNRWFPQELVGNPGEAQFLDIILYSREQIRKENTAMGEDSGSDAPWGIVSVKPQDVAQELPMQPITSMRNSLGAEYGGSGVPFDVEAYKASVAFWEKHATVR